MKQYRITSVVPIRAPLDHARGLAKWQVKGFWAAVPYGSIISDAHHDIGALVDAGVVMEEIIEPALASEGQ